MVLSNTDVSFHDVREIMDEGFPNIPKSGSFLLRIELGYHKDHLVTTKSGSD
jgi:hypothetical protein